MLPVATAAALAVDGARAQASSTADAGGPTQVIVVTGSIGEQRIEDAPYSIDVIDEAELREAGPMINLSEALVRVPGLVVNNRSNYAQDQQVSSRGFGARASFGVRGLRLYSDGIPATMPDGQGQVAHFDLASAQRIEVLRGPFSVLYGSNSGGVISVITGPIRDARYELAADVGSFGLWQLRGSAQTPLGNGWGVQGNVSAMSIDGFRPQSEAERQTGHLRLAYEGDRDRLRIVAGTWRQPAQDPLGLTREQFDQDAESTDPRATEYDTRKDSHQTQVGASWQHRFDAGALRESNVAVYAGRRGVTQYLAIPPGAQASPRHGGGVIDFTRDYGGVDGRLRWSWDRIDVQAGVAIERQQDDRQGYENYTGTADDPVLGVMGALRRDETNTSTSRDGYLQAEFSATDDLVFSAGVRSGRVKLSADDHYLSNGDDSGEVSYSYTNPVAGVRWRVTPHWQVFASAARGTESPTLGEIAYRADGTGGFNDSLKSQVSRQFEMGARWRDGAWRMESTLFRADTSRELAVLTNAGGRASYTNVGRTRRQGFELAGGYNASHGLFGNASLTWLDAAYRDDFLACAGIPCMAPDTPVPAGNRIAGTQRTAAWTELGWRSAAWGTFAAEWRAAGKTAVNDTNTDFASGYVVTNLRWSQRYDLAEQRAVEVLVRVDNVFDRRYANSVIVNDGNGRYFEPGAPRNFLLGVRLLGVL